MAEKKYYWLKLKRDFFKRHDMRIIEKMKPNGKEYVLFYLKLMVESIDHEGTLRFSDELPYDNEMLSAITETDIDVVEAAIHLFLKLNIVEILDDGTIVLPGVQQLIGSETAAAERMRKKRNQASVVSERNNVQKCYTEIEKEKEKDKDKELKRKKDNSCQQIVVLFNSLCPSFSPIKHLSDPIIKDIEDSLTKYTVDDFKLLFKKAEASTFLKGVNERSWAATFDWLVKPDNIAKVLNGNFDNKRKKAKKSSAASFDIEAYERMIEKAANPPKTMAEDESIRERAEALQKKLNGSDTE